MGRDQQTVSYNMSRIKCKDTKIELLLRKELWHRGLRYQKNSKKVFGKPDIVFLGKKIAVFCDSEFWHGFDWENRKDDFKKNQDFWITKIERNMKRDDEVNEVLQMSGWIVLRYWGKEIKNNLSGCADEIEKVWKKR
ncbi:MAG: very short patch repair endonuclease [Candidatus Treponema excrementipullorum]|nr:very short patch repair endonuclease [Candidatus Treponema excrementipullorum]MDY2756411.1 very short patch repair endonuclease [Candidatus Treponema excrementipullorum]MDY4708429.1 very short patch repair endonuclease [Candidatus Treponema excrementipullorum]